MTLEETRTYLIIMSGSFADLNKLNHNQKRGDGQVSDHVKPALHVLSCCWFHILIETL